MPALEEMGFVTVEDYLAGELVSEVKHEYLGGTVHAMAGGTANHSRVARNFTTSLDNSLRGKRCEPFNSDFKVRIELPFQTRFYYPDALVTCQPVEGDSQYIDTPTVVAEVLSPSTRRTDQTEKKEAYLTITSLKVLLLIEADTPHVTVHRRSPNGGFEVEVYRSLDDEIPLPEVEASLPMARLYDRIA
jgi:Uma2 family endonuclease